jgi:hypothetical protein
VRVNLEAADEICRQLRLRNMGGLIVLDFIDMKSRRDQQAVYQRIKEGLRRDKAKTHVLPISQLGLMEMTRQRHSESVRSAVYDDCPYCKGRGKVKSAITMSVEIQRKLNEILKKRSARRLGFPTPHRRASDRAGAPAHRGRKIDHRNGKAVFRQAVLPAGADLPRRAIQDRQRGHQRGTGQRRFLRAEGKAHMEMDILNMQGGHVPPAAAARMKQMGMGKLTVIIRRDKGLSYMVYPDMKAYTETATQEKYAPVADYKSASTKLGQETIDGHDCVKNKVVVTAPDGHARVNGLERD